MKALNTIIKDHWGGIVALLSNYIQDLDLAEDAMQDALESALIHWQKSGIPNHPQAWLFTTAKHKALDKIRRAQNFANKQQQYQLLLDLNLKPETQEQDYSIPDERLRLIFTCCHPALDPSVAVALTLRLLGGLSTEEIAKSFLLKTKTMAQRIVRGKKKIKFAGIPYKIPEKEDFSQRLDVVLTVLYLIFNEGYAASGGDKPIRQGLCDEAIRLTQILFKLCPQQAEVKGLLALMLLHDSRKKSRYNHKGEFVPMEQQDRKLWNKKQIEQGIQLTQSALKQKQLGSYQLQAAISAIHAEAKDHKSTNWLEVVLIYDKLLSIKSSDVIRLNRLAALSQIKPVQELIEPVNQLESSLKKYQPFYAVKADFLNKIGEVKKAKFYYQKAIDLCENEGLKGFLIDKLQKL